jgi:hypothetical protein
MAVPPGQSCQIRRQLARESSLQELCNEIMSSLRLLVPNCWMFATLPANISSVTIAPHENPD